MSAPSMVHRSGDTLIVRSVVSGDALFGTGPAPGDPDDIDYEHASLAAPSPPSRYDKPYRQHYAAGGCGGASSLPECKVKRNYACGTCDFFTQNPRSYLYHLRDVHGERVKIYECPNCLYASKHFQKLLRHTKMVHGAATTIGASVNQSGHHHHHNNNNIDEHETDVSPPPATRGRASRKRSYVVDEHDDDLITIAGGGDDSGSEDAPPVDSPPQQQQQHRCSMCAFVAKSGAQLAKHERDEHIKTKFFRCTKCTYVTHMKARFTKHVKYHSMPMIKCDMCDFRTPYKWNLDRHCKNHNGRGAFRCSACNFTADIKQSLTVHEMNHHVPPVGQAVGLGVGRRRNKVGASDSTAAEDGCMQLSSGIDTIDYVALHSPAASSLKADSKSSNHGSGEQEACVDFAHPDDQSHHHHHHQHTTTLHANGKKSHTAAGSSDSSCSSTTSSGSTATKCRYCSFATGWEDEMVRHEKHAHADLMLTPPKKKAARPVPDLLPIGQTAKTTTTTVAAARATTANASVADMSQSDMSSLFENSSLKDFARLFSSEDVFGANNNNNIGRGGSKGGGGESFFDKFKFNMGDAESLTCEACGYESKCVTEHTAHRRSCGGRLAMLPAHQVTPIHKLTSTRCQHCRQRCKSSKDLFNHMQTCVEALKSMRSALKQETDEDAEMAANDEYDDKKPHPMENKVFIWNKMEEDDAATAAAAAAAYEGYAEQMRIGQPDPDQVSLDLSIRTQSPNSESSSSHTPHAAQHQHHQHHHHHHNNNNNVMNNNNYADVVQVYTSTSASLTPLPSSLTTPVAASTPVATTAAAPTEKIPTHGNDISVAQHKRVFKCPHCTFWASTASRFHVHIVGHLNKKPFECSLCAYRSNWRWDITKHIKLKSVRDPAHEAAKVLMTDETGRRNYTKYNKYLTEINVKNGPDANETSGGMGTRPKDKQQQQQQQQQPRGGNNNNHSADKGSLRPPPQLKPANEYITQATTTSPGTSPDKKKSSPGDGKKTYWQCKKCNFRDLCKDKLLMHVRAHYPSVSVSDVGGAIIDGSPGGSSATSERRYVSSSGGGGAGGGNIIINHQLSAVSGGDLDSEASVAVQAGGGSARGHAPFSCGHCQQVSNWKHVIQRHCRLKHSGDIKVITASGAPIKDVDLAIDEAALEHTDVVQDGSLKCSHCPFSSDDAENYHMHLEGHIPTANATVKCLYCNYYVVQREHLADHLRLHGVSYAHYLSALKLDDKHHSLAGEHFADPTPAASAASSSSKRYKCTTCPYVTNSKSQFTYHKQFHKPKNGQYSCDQCGYNVSKRHLLHQHMKVHGIAVSPAKQNGEAMDLEEISDEIEEVHSPSFDWQSLAEIPLVWVSKSGKFSKMYRCRSCPHVNLRKVNIMEHEKMHNYRDRSKGEDYRCPECNYACNNAGVLSSHNKVHQGLCGVVHGLVDSSKTDEEQIRELGATPAHIDGDATPVDADFDAPDMLHFCSKCPARFLKEKEFGIHSKFHGANLLNRCEHCTYSSQQKSYLAAHSKVHSNDYQERTRALVDTSRISPENPPPEVTHVGDAWIVEDASSEEEVDSAYNSSGMSYQRRMNVPLSGTDLFLQKSEAEAEAHEGGGVHSTSVSRNGGGGRVKEKRYRCPKCPSAFEKREQFKHHLGLHGSNQQFSCSNCDYSVANQANLVQHEKKHRKLHEEDIEEVDMSQAAAMLASPVAEVKKPFWCMMCPYTNARRDAVDNHQKRHYKLSGIESAYTCQFCDYSVPQLHVLRDHTKLHFLPNKMHAPDAFLAQGSAEYAVSGGGSTLDTYRVRDDDYEDDDDDADDDGDDDDDVDSSAASLNNNEGEKMFVNTLTGEIEESRKDSSDMDTS